MKKKNNNPFSMTLPYVMAFLFVGVAATSYFLKFTIIQSFLDLITIGNLFNLTKLGDSIGMLNPIAITNLIVYGFVFGWLLVLTMRKLK